MDYNSQRPKLIIAEYGRYVQNMVDYCKTIEDEEERTRCAHAIVQVMATFADKSGDSEDFTAKLWNHLAAMANYELNIYYPVPIERASSIAENRERIPYPQQRIRRRHYGAIVEKFAEVVRKEEDEKKRLELAKQIANHMKRDLSNWNADAMSDQKVTEDIMEYTDGNVDLSKEDFEYITDGELLSTLISTSVKKRKKK